MSGTAFALAGATIMGDGRVVLILDVAAFFEGRRQALAPLKKQLGEAEAAVSRLEAQRERITRAMADPALYDGGGAGSLVELQKQLGVVQRGLADAEQAWTSLQEDWDRAQAEAP